MRKLVLSLIQKNCPKHAQKMAFFSSLANRCLSSVSDWFALSTPPAEAALAEAVPAGRADARKRLRESVPTLTLSQAAQLEKKARVAGMYAYAVEHMCEGENTKSVAREIGASEGINERTVRRWAQELAMRGARSAAVARSSTTTQCLVPSRK